MGKLKLTVNETKTRSVNCRKRNSTFWLYVWSVLFAEDRARVPWYGASKKRVIRICEAISEMTGRDQTLLEQEIVVAKLNRTMIGWANYFCLGPVSKPIGLWKATPVRGYAVLCAKHKVMSGTKRFSEASLYDVLGLVCLTKRTALSVGDIVTLSPRAGSGKSDIRFDERGVKTEAWYS